MEALEHSKECNFYEGTEKLLEIWFTKSNSAIDNENNVNNNNNNNGITNGHHHHHHRHHHNNNNINNNSNINNNPDLNGAVNRGRPSSNEGHHRVVNVVDSSASPALAAPNGQQVVAAGCDLRRIQRAAWESLLKFARCQILSMRRSDHFDGYVLSESSMFVYRDRIILKTCGQTTLLNCIEPLLYLAREIAGFDEILDVFYSRKNFMRPELQDKSHSSFDHEIEILDAQFELGSAYCMGKVNRDCWYLYTLHPERGVTCADQTLELIMVDLDEKMMNVFTQQCSSSAREATQKSGIDKLFQHMQVDDFLFEPCGYSMNGFLKGGYYVTIHVTPELDFSYVSFETNVPQTSYRELIARILSMFAPTKFMMTIFANESSQAYNHLHEYKSSSFHGYQLEENQFTRFKNYELTFGNYCREAG